jgi:chaperone modulatory protein CbpM
MIEPMDDLVGTVLDDRVEFTLLELCRLCDANARHIAEIVEEGIVAPAGTSPMHWRFTGLMMRRVQVVLRLERDLDINLPGAAMIIELLEETGAPRA